MDLLITLTTCMQCAAKKAKCTAMKSELFCLQQQQQQRQQLIRWLTLYTFILAAEARTPISASPTVPNRPKKRKRKKILHNLYLPYHLP